MSNSKSTIWVSKSTKEALRSCKIHDREYDDDILVRLIKLYKRVKKIKGDKRK